MELKNKIIEYIKTHGFDIEKVALETGVSIERLTKESDENIDADDLCVICVYLNVRPENLYSRRISESEDELCRIQK